MAFEKASVWAGCVESRRRALAITREMGCKHREYMTGRIAHTPGYSAHTPGYTRHTPGRTKHTPGYMDIRRVYMGHTMPGHIAHTPGDIGRGP
ncbi:hypothetical protein [Bacteroides pyogenes]|uniref:hypothetical protein n=1 Tax=Bacteroides pyogenes TaxID=310300 RepID=UPI000EFBB1A1|nr:hypothetical protein [Bacteroides pyogenes]MBB3894149.1 hypothetical protein [Bacteroides pyogenes]